MKGNLMRGPGRTIWRDGRLAGIRIIAIAAISMISVASADYEQREEGSSSGVSGERSAGGNDFRPCTDGKCIKRTTQEVSSGMWFGPRLGRRRRSEKKSEMSEMVLATDFEGLANALREAEEGRTRWAVITIPGGEKRQPTQFTPRLGRESVDGSLLLYGGKGAAAARANAIIEQQDDTDAATPDLFPPPLFAPRLGRRALPWKPSPRLGRQLPFRAILDKSYQYSDSDTDLPSF